MVSALTEVPWKNLCEIVIRLKNERETTVWGIRGKKYPLPGARRMTGGGPFSLTVCVVVVSDAITW